ncbi:unnamed protein product [Rotaria magnacalcarata]
MSDEVPKARKAKIIGNSNRQVAAFIDNQPSSTSSNSSSEKMNKSGATDNDVDNFGSPIPSPSVSQQSPTSNEIDSPTMENQPPSGQSVVVVKVLTSKVVYLIICTHCFLVGGETTVYTNDGERYVNEVAKIDDERMPHNKPGLLSMPVHDLSIKFLITLCPMPSLNESHVVIGRVIEGMGLIEAINKKGIKNSSGIECDRGLPLANVTIYGCGETNNTTSY